MKTILPSGEDLFEDEYNLEFIEILWRRNHCQLIENEIGLLILPNRVLFGNVYNLEIQWYK